MAPGLFGRGRWPGALLYPLGFPSRRQPHSVEASGARRGPFPVFPLERAGKICSGPRGRSVPLPQSSAGQAAICCVKLRRRAFERCLEGVRAQSAREAGRCRKRRFVFSVLGSSERSWGERLPGSARKRCFQRVDRGIARSRACSLAAGREGAISLIQSARACISSLDEMAIEQQWGIEHARCS